MIIPNAVLKVAEDRTCLGGIIKYFGDLKGEEVFSYEYNEPVTIGLPVIYLWNGKRVKVIEGDKALEILNSLS